MVNTILVKYDCINNAFMYYELQFFILFYVLRNSNLHARRLSSDMMADFLYRCEFACYAYLL